MNLSLREFSKIKGGHFVAQNREFGNRRLHSLLGVVPIGLFLMVHLISQLLWQQKEQKPSMQRYILLEFTPFKIVLEFVVIYLPLIFHAVYGIYIAFTAKNNLGRFSFFRNWMFFLQRVSGIITLIFLVWHVYTKHVFKQHLVQK